MTTYSHYGASTEATHKQQMWGEEVLWKHDEDQNLWFWFHNTFKEWTVYVGQVNQAFLDSKVRIGGDS